MKNTTEFIDKVSDITYDLKMLMQIINQRAYIMSGTLAIPCDDVFEYVLNGLERCHKALEAIVDDKEDDEHEGV